MRYIFEFIHDGETDDRGNPVIDELDDREFDDDQTAIEHGMIIGANYVWEATPDGEPPRGVASLRGSREDLGSG